LKSHYIIPVFIPESACPNRCIFCNQRFISGAAKAPDAEETRSIIEKYLQSIPSSAEQIEIGFFGGNFTGIPIYQQKQYLQMANEYYQQKKIHAVRLSTRPDYIDEERLSLLKEFHVQTIELGAQSMDDEVLQKCGRGHTAKNIMDASALIRSFGFNLGLQMMIGLPGDTPEKNINTAKKIIELGADNTRIYPLLVIKDTALQQMFHHGEYLPLTLDEAVEQTKKVYLLFEQAGVNILRVGLHPSEGLINGENIIAGPFHVSFRELVLTSIWKDLLLPYMKSQSQQGIRISVSSEEFNFAIGYDGTNKKQLQKFYKKVHFVRDEKLKQRNFHVDFY
jgi:histone acetyltransferase (RNA polymerase elongator complex component)